MKISAVVFDLDGTLLDTLADIAKAANQSLAAEGFPKHPIDAFRDYIGEGVARLFAQSIGLHEVDDPAVQRCMSRFHGFYAECWNQRTQPYDGIVPLLDTLVARGHSLAVLSNKPHEPVIKCVAEYFPGQVFQAIYGQRDGVPRKPDPSAAIQIAKQLDVLPVDCAFVGDTPIDMETARAAEMVPVGVAWGFRPAVELKNAGAQVVLQQPAEFVEWLVRNDE